MLYSTGLGSSLESSDKLVFSVKLSIPADASKASCKALGNAFPLLLARRRMPAHAFAESQYFGGIDAAGSSSEDKDAHPALWWSEVLQIEHPPRGHGITSTCHTAALPSVRGNSNIGSHDG